MQLLDHYLRLERPPDCGSPLFVGLKGRARGRRMTAAGLRSLFRHHRRITGVPKANPHRFRHTFATDMIRAGISLPALMQLMGHAKIQTTLVYVQLTATGRIPAVRPRRRATDPAHPYFSVMRRCRPLHHPLETLFERAAESLCTALSDGSVRSYHATFRSFLRYLSAHHPEICRLAQVRRDPHVLGWLAELRSHTPPLAKITLATRVVYLHRLLEELAWTEQVPTLTRLLSREDVPRRERTLPAPV